MPSARRAAQISDDDHHHGHGDSKSKKMHPILFFAMRGFSNCRTRIGYIGPCLFLFCLALLLSSFLLHSRNLVCVSVSPYYPRSRVGFFSFDGFESDFGLLGVPWCKSIRFDPTLLFISQMFLCSVLAPPFGC